MATIFKNSEIIKNFPRVSATFVAKAAQYQEAVRQI
jgi:hypothetical protein